MTSTTRRTNIELIIAAATAPKRRGNSIGDVELSLAEVRQLEEQGLMAGYSVDVVAGAGPRWTPDGLEAIRQAIAELERDHDGTPLGDLGAAEDRVVDYLETRDAAHAYAAAELRHRGLPRQGGASPDAPADVVAELEHDLYRAERELAAIRERTAVDQRLDGDDDSERVLRRIAGQARERLDGNRTDVPAAPIILVTTGHPTVYQHPGANGEAVHPRLGRLLQPRHLSSVELTAAAGIPWAADNDCFQGLDEVAFVKMIDRLAGLPGCLFATVPDVVGDHAATVEQFAKWAPELERRGLPLGFVAQDGATAAGVPWDRIAALFIGGSNDFKLGPQAANLAREAKARGKWVHWGRVNTRRRFDLIVATGAADSFDGSKWARWRKTYLPAGLEWLDEAEERRAICLEAVEEIERRGLRRVAGGSNELEALAVVDADGRRV